MCYSGANMGALRSNCTTCALSSSAFMDSCPSGFSHVRNDSRRCCGSGSCQTYGVPLLLKKTPPRPCPHASVAPNQVGLCGKSSRRCVGRVLIVAKRCFHRCNICCTLVVMRTRAPFFGIAACSTENRPLPPATPGARLRRVPSIFSTFLLWCGAGYLFRLVTRKFF